MIVRTSLAALLAALALGGCMFTPAAESIDPNTCVTDDDCVQDVTQCDPDVRSCEFVCDQELAACVMPADELSEQLVLKITDEFGMSSEQRFEVSSDSTDQPLAVAVPDPVQVTGLVMDLRGEAARPLPAFITFTRQSQYPALDPSPISVTSGVETIPNELGLEYNFTIGLVPGRYGVQAVPDEPVEADPSVRLYYPIQQVCDVAQDSFTCHDAFETPVPELNLFYDNDARIISSQVLGPDGGPVNGVRVYASDQTGRISAFAETACEVERPTECGRFTLAVPATTDQFSLELSRPSEPLDLDSALWPTITTGPFYFTFDTNADERLDVSEIGPLSFPEHADPVLYDPVVQGQGRDGIWMPLAGVSVRLRSAFGAWADGAYEFDATTDELGALVPAVSHLQGPEGRGIMLIPGTYAIEITPAPGGDLANTVVPDVVVAGPEDGEAPLPLELRVTARSLVEGLVTTPSGEPLAGVQVEATNANGVSFTDTTDERGLYSLYVDPSAYDVMFAPPEDSLLSRARRVDVQVFGDARLDVVIGWGVPVRGAVTRAADDQPIVSAVIESYVVRQGDPDNPPLIPIGLARTGDDGGFVVIVPDDEGF